MGTQSYHVQLPQHLLTADVPICHLEADNATIKMWVTVFQHKLVHLYCDNEMAVNIFQADCGRDPFIQACAQQLWLTCASHDITLAVGYIPGVLLTSLADALSCCHMGKCYKDHVNVLINDMGVKLVKVFLDSFVLSSSHCYLSISGYYMDLHNSKPRQQH